MDTGFLYDIPIDLVVELGRTTLTVRELSELRSDDVVRLDSLAGQPLNLLAGGQLFGRGEVVIEDDRVGLRILDLVGHRAQAEAG